MEFISKLLEIQTNVPRIFYQGHTFDHPIVTLFTDKGYIGVQINFMRRFALEAETP